MSVYIIYYLRYLVSEKELQKLYKNFSKIDKDKSGMLEPEEFFDIPGRINFILKLKHAVNNGVELA